MDNETKEMLQLILSKVTSLENDMSTVKQDLSEVKQLATKTAVVQETEIANKIQLIYENQINIIEHNEILRKQDTRIENLEDDVFSLKNAFDSLKQA